MGEKFTILKFEIPLPPEDEVQAYLDMGWYRLPGLLSGEPDYLKWSYGKGSPRHPGDDVEA
jgi:hypothetical protein